MDVQHARQWAQHMREWAHSLRLKPEQRRLIDAALDSFEVLSRASTVTSAELGPLIEATRHPTVPVSCVGGHALAQLACEQAAAQQAFRELVGSRKSKERCNAIYCLSAGMPRALLLELLTRCLNDRSTLVRRNAAVKCDTLRLAEMVPEMTRRAASEPDAGVKHKLVYHAAMIRDGYVVERREGGQLWLHVRAKDGWSYRSITQEDVDSGRIPALVAKVLSHP